ncbi:esterase/lipase family protein [Parerythrobacter aestuarii]|uniref:esterase/lipase family protein n=1 Tax=Parerythrobacter aestuarii TaxID=3020909 RepID=UPI0024DE7A66|nr:alpha/beta fold hydrolase [Parerythrobacter aestuarii]
MLDVTIQRPSLALALTEVPRSLFEMALIPFCSPVLANAPRGDGHPVLVLPGFMTSDMSTFAMRRYLDSLGYQTYPWELGRNLGIRSTGIDGERVKDRVELLYREHGRKVSLVGWSLGGIMARQLARKHPEMVRQVITLGSPFTGNPGATNVTALYEWMTGDYLEEDLVRERIAEESAPLPVPSTAIFSRQDGVTAWENCLDADLSGETENIELYGSHMGLVFNPAVWFAVADRLAQPEGEWAPFDRSGQRAMFYPQAA